MLPNDDADISELCALLAYCPESGNLIWSVARPGVAKGAIAGCVNQYGYIVIRFKYKRYYAHRLAWVMMTGEWPKHQVDHANCIKSDNRWSNLRVATGSQNGANKRKLPFNKSGFKGVSRNCDKWRALIYVDKKKISLRCFSTKELAANAYWTAAKRYFGEFARAV